MALIRQFYEAGGAPLRIDAPVEEPSAAWRSHRSRMRAWLDALPDDAWGGPTRCADWDVLALVRHLASGSQFLGYTLHRAAAGEATTLLREFDSHATVQAAARTLGEISPAKARAAVAKMDASVDRELDAMADAGWSAMAEAPPGHVPAHLAVNHFVFDSWVHEHDLLRPRGERPVVDPTEASVVVRYLVGLAALLTGAETALDLRLHDPDLRVAVSAADGVVEVSGGRGRPGAAVIEGPLIGVVDRATGRAGASIEGDERGLAVLDGGAALMRS